MRSFKFRNDDIEPVELLRVGEDSPRVALGTEEIEGHLYYDFDENTLENSFLASELVNNSVSVSDGQFNLSDIRIALSNGQEINDYDRAAVLVLIRNLQDIMNHNGAEPDEIDDAILMLERISQEIGNPPNFEVSSPQDTFESALEDYLKIRQEEPQVVTSSEGELVQDFLEKYQEQARQHHQDQRDALDRLEESFKGLLTTDQLKAYPGLPVDTMRSFGPTFGEPMGIYIDHMEQQLHFQELEEKIKEFEETLSPEQREAWEQFKELHQGMLGPTKLQDLKMDIPQLDPEILVTPKGDSDPADAILDLGKEIDGPHDYIRGLDEEQVKEIQRALGVDDDGKFGEKTLAAYIEYANNNELENGLTIEQLVQHFEENHSAPTVAFSDELDGLNDLWGADFGFEDFEPPQKFDFTNADLLAGRIGELPVNFSDQANVNVSNSYAVELNKPFTMLNEQDEVSLEGNVLNNTVDRTV